MNTSKSPVASVNMFCEPTMCRDNAANKRAGILEADLTGTVEYSNLQRSNDRCLAAMSDTEESEARRERGRRSLCRRHDLGGASLRSKPGERGWRLE